MSNPNPPNQEALEKNNFKNMSAKEQRKIASMGGKAAQEKQALNKSWAAILEELGMLPIKSEKNKAIMREAGIPASKMISDYQKLFRLNQKADAGDPKATELVAKIRKQLTNYNVNENHNYEMKPLVDLRVKKKDGVDNSVSEG